MKIFWRWVARKVREAEKDINGEIFRQGMAQAIKDELRRYSETSIKGAEEAITASAVAIAQKYAKNELERAMVRKINEPDFEYQKRVSRAFAKYGIKA